MFDMQYGSIVYVHYDTGDCLLLLVDRIACIELSYTFLYYILDSFMILLYCDMAGRTSELLPTDCGCH
jgi:hypothetical protein